MRTKGSPPDWSLSWPGAVLADGSLRDRSLSWPDVVLDEGRSDGTGTNVPLLFTWVDFTGWHVRRELVSPRALANFELFASIFWTVAACGAALSKQVH